MLARLESKYKRMYNKIDNYEADDYKIEEIFNLSFDDVISNIHREIFTSIFKFFEKLNLYFCRDTFNIVFQYCAFHRTINRNWGPGSYNDEWITGLKTSLIIITDFSVDFCIDNKILYFFIKIKIMTNIPC